MFLRRLNLDAHDDRRVANDLFLSTPDYELNALGNFPSVTTEHSLRERFPPQCAPEHRLTFAAFDRANALGLIQIATHLPDEGSAAILLMLIRAEHRKKHLGCEIVSLLSRQARRWDGISRWHINVLENNIGALAFWRHCGFHTGTCGLAIPGFTHRLLSMTRKVKARSVCKSGAEPEDADNVTARNLYARFR